MFEITEETKREAIERMREILLDAEINDKSLGEAFDAAVKVVKSQFGF